MAQRQTLSDTDTRSFLLRLPLAREDHGRVLQTGTRTSGRRAGEDLDPLIWAAGIVYLLIPLGIVLFAFPHVSPENLPGSSLFWGFVYGVVLYGIYDMTNLAMLAGWSLKLS